MFTLIWPTKAGNFSLAWELLLMEQKDLDIIRTI
jgi:hypothetical protein